MHDHRAGAGAVTTWREPAPCATNEGARGWRRRFHSDLMRPAHARAEFARHKLLFFPPSLPRSHRRMAGAAMTV